MAYKPEYADGQIIVRFIDDFSSEKILEGICCSFEYSILEGEETLNDGDYVVAVSSGKEEEAIRRFKRLKLEMDGEGKKIVEYAERRDLKQERWGSLIDDIRSEAEDLIDIRSEAEDLIDLLGSASDDEFYEARKRITYKLERSDV